MSKLIGKNISVFVASYRTANTYTQMEVARGIESVTGLLVNDIMSVLYNVSPDIEYTIEVPYQRIKNNKDFLKIITLLINKNNNNE